VKTKKQQIKQQIIATLVIVFMFTMIFGSVEIRDVKAIGDNTTLVQNFTAGTLELESPASVGFNDIALGTGGTNSLANLVIVNMRDYRGTGAGWTVSGTMNDMMTSGGGGLNKIVNSTIAWDPQTATLYGLDGASTDGMAKGSAGYFSASRTLVNAAVNAGLGNYCLNGTELNIVWDGAANQVSGTYQNTLTLTIS